MTDNTQPEALRLAKILEGDYCPDWFYEQGVDEVAAELRRLHAENAAPQQGYDAARLEIDHLRGALATAAQPVPAAEIKGPLNELEELNLLNEPAFPIHGGLHEHQLVGASLRDYFAAKAMQAFLSSYPNGAVYCGLAHIADDAYDMADAMLKARAKGGAE